MRIIEKGVFPHPFFTVLYFLNNLDIFIHFGNNSFNKERIKQLENWGSKPHSHCVLWGSPVNSTKGWHQFCKENLPERSDFNKWFMFDFLNENKILRLRYISSFYKVKIENYLGVPRIDFVSMKKDGCAAIWLDIDGLDITQRSVDLNQLFYGWDCDSIVVLDPNAIFVYKQSP